MRQARGTAGKARQNNALKRASGSKGAAALNGAPLEPQFVALNSGEAGPP
jgi:hypothetical protein